MALRPEIRGFDLSRLHSLFGSRDEAVISAIQGQFDRFAAAQSSGIDESFRTTFRDSLLRAIREGAPFPGLAVETEPHVRLATLLAGYEQQFIATDSSDWKLNAFEEFWEACESAIPDDVQPLFGYFLDGRPLFGGRIATAWSFYGFLSHTELRRLAESLDAISREQSELMRNELVEDLIADFRRWSTDILTGGKDLWFWTA